MAHELTAAWAASGTAGPAAPWTTCPGRACPGLGVLPLRASVGDPCALPRRCALTAVTTLTLRRAPGGAASFLLHWRDPARVNHAGGVYQVMPAGIFQPVSAAPAAQRHDFSLWRCMTREFSEELLGGSEEYPTRGGRLDYGRWPFHRELAAARDAGTLRVSCLGLGVDPLTLATDILTVAVFEAAVFDRMFRGLVTENAEGRVVTQDGSAAIPFTRASVDRFTGGGEPVQTAGDGPAPAGLAAPGPPGRPGAAEGLTSSDPGGWPDPGEAPYQVACPWLAARSELTYPARCHAEPAMSAGAASLPRRLSTLLKPWRSIHACKPVEQRRGVPGPVAQQRRRGHHHVRAGQQVGGHVCCVADPGAGAERGPDPAGEPGDPGPGQPPLGRAGTARSPR